MYSANQNDPSSCFNCSIPWRLCVFFYFNHMTESWREAFVPDRTPHRCGRRAFCLYLVSLSLMFIKTVTAVCEYARLTLFLSSFNSFNGNGRIFKYCNETRLVAHAILKIRIFDYKKQTIFSIDFYLTDCMDLIISWKLTDSQVVNSATKIVYEFTFLCVLHAPHIPSSLSLPF